MAEALFMTWDPDDTDDVGPRARYDAVSAELDLDEIPDGAIWHAGVLGEDGRFVVVEVWETRAQQERFMAEKLGPAFERTGARPPTTVEWMEVAGLLPAVPA